MKNIKACLFDLDGVIVDTAKYHYIAWKKLANELGSNFTERENEKLKGVGRMDSLNLILKWGKIDLDDVEKEAWAAKKNEWYLEFVHDMTPAEILPGVIEMFESLKAQNIKIGLGSASKNAVLILDLLNIKHYFDTIVDGTMITKGKPNPEIFLTGAKNLDVKPLETIVFEDAAEGVKAAIAAKMYTVGIGDHKVLNRAHLVIQSFADMSFQDIKDCLATAEIE
jgi:beta-phosphoglucomutase